MKKILYSLLIAPLFALPALANTPGSFQRERVTIERQSVNIRPQTATTGRAASTAQPYARTTAARPTTSGQKHILANPFFQPRGNEFLSTTDLSYTANSFDFSVTSLTSPPLNGETATYTSGMVALTQNLAYGINDEIAVLGMVRFSILDLNISWDNPAYSDDDQTKNRLDAWGLGVQWKFLDDKDWIAQTVISYQSLVDAANMVALEGKVGYKNDDTIIYGFVRGHYVNWDGSGYGLALTASRPGYNDQTTQFVLGDKGSVLLYDVGAGLFAALNQDWSVDANLTYTDADWHSQVALGAAIAYQPWRNAAIQLYGRIALWDNASDVSAPIQIVELGSIVASGTAKFDNYSDMSAGLRLMISF